LSQSPPWKNPRREPPVPVSVSASPEVLQLQSRGHIRARVFAACCVRWLPGLFWKNEYRWTEYNSRTDTVNCPTAALCGVVGPTAFAERNNRAAWTVQNMTVH
jgi:hypothetical protein